MLAVEQPNTRVHLKPDGFPGPGANVSTQDEALVDTLRGFTLPTASLSYNPAARTGSGVNNKFAQGFFSGSGGYEAFTHRGGGAESKPALFISRDAVDNVDLEQRVEQSQKILGRGARSEAFFPGGGVRALATGIASLDPEVDGNQFGGCTVTNTAPQALTGNRDMVSRTPIVRLDNFRNPYNSLTGRAPMQAPNPYQAGAFAELLSVAKSKASSENMRRLRKN